MTLAKLTEVVAQLNKMADETKKEWKKMACKLAESGAISDGVGEIGELHNYLIAKAVIDAWCLDRPYAPLSIQNREEFANIRRFI